MKDTKKIKVSKRIILVLLLAALVVASCRAKTTHLTQDLENPGGSVQNTSQRPEEATQIPGEEIASVIDLTATSIEPLATQSAPVTSTPVQASASAPVVLTPTATKKPATTQAATSTSAPTQTRTPTRTATITPTGTATLTPSPTLQTGWAGEWTFYVGEGDGPYKSANGTISLDGLTAEGLFTLDGVAFSFIAGLSEDQLNLNGRYEWGATEGWLNWVMDSNHVQFRGTLDNVYAFCAARDGMPMPEPCGDYVPY